MTKESDIINQHKEVLDLKVNILNTIQKSETESLKGRKVDNEIKEIVKEREILELKIKTRQYNNLCSNSFR